MIFLSIISIVLLFKFSKYINMMYFDTRLDSTFKNSRVCGDYETSMQKFLTFQSIVNTFIFEPKYIIISLIVQNSGSLNLVNILRSKMMHNYRPYQICKQQQAFIIWWTSVISTYNYVNPHSNTTILFWILGLLCLTLYNFYNNPVTESICAANSANF